MADADKQAGGDAWGDAISDERKAELQALADTQREWVVQPRPTRGESRFKGVQLTGADVFWLAAYALAGVTGDVASAQEQLHNLQNIKVNVKRFRDGRVVTTTPDLSNLHLERSNLRKAHLEGAVILSAHLEGAHLDGASLINAYLYGAHLQGAKLSGVHLEGAMLDEAHLEDADLHWAHLEGAVLQATHLERANLSHARLDKMTLLDAATVGRRNIDGVKVAGVHWGKADLSGVDWRLMTRLGDERIYEDRTFDSYADDAPPVPPLWMRLGERLSIWLDADSHRDVVRAYRKLATALRAQGLTEEADRYTYRAQIWQRRVFVRELRLPQYVGSWFLALLAGYGYRPSRTIFLYLLVICAFAATYVAFGTGCHIAGPADIVTVLASSRQCAPETLSWREAIVVSLTAFHGRGFFVGTFKPSDPQAAVAAVEAVVGLLLEVSFIATFTQRFFAR